MLARPSQAPITAVALLTAGAGYLLGPWWALPGLAALAILVWAFYDPPTVTPSLPLAVVSPVSGLARSIATRADPWLRNRQALRITVHAALPGFTAIRAPLEAKVIDFWVRGGVSKDHEADGSPTCYTLWLQTDEGDDLVVAVHGRRMISRFKASVAPGERVGHGRPLGFIYFATAVIVYLPEACEEAVAAGQRVTAGASVLATLVRQPAAAGGAQ